MYVIVETGAKQYRLSKDDIFEAEKLDSSPGKEIKIDKVLLYSDGKNVEIGRPYLKNVRVNCEVMGQTKGKKLISYKYKRRKDFRRKVGHRQKLTSLRVKDISID